MFCYHHHADTDFSFQYAMCSITLSTYTSLIKFFYQKSTKFRINLFTLENLIFSFDKLYFRDREGCVQLLADPSLGHVSNLLSSRLVTGGPWCHGAKLDQISLLTRGTKTLVRCEPTIPSLLLPWHFKSEGLPGYPGPGRTFNSRYLQGWMRLNMKTGTHV